jgi:hypothetical protein
VPWRDLPSEFGPWKTVFNRFDRWAKSGKWERLFLALQTDRDDEWHSLDSTINRAHQHASGGKGGLREEIQSQAVHVQTFMIEYHAALSANARAQLPDFGHGHGRARARLRPRNWGHTLDEEADTLCRSFSTT